MQVNNYLRVVLMFGENETQILYKNWKWVIDLAYVIKRKVTFLYYFNLICVYVQLL